MRVEERCVDDGSADAEELSPFSAAILLLLVEEWAPSGCLKLLELSLDSCF